MQTIRLLKNIDYIQVARAKVVKLLSEVAQLHRNSGDNKKKCTGQNENILQQVSRILITNVKYL